MENINKKENHIRLCEKDIEMIEKSLNSGKRIEIYPVKANDVAIAELMRVKIK